MQRRGEMTQLISETATRSDGWRWNSRSRGRSCSREAGRAPVQGASAARSENPYPKDYANTTGIYVFGFSSDFLRIPQTLLLLWPWIKGTALPLNYRIKLSVTWLRGNRSPAVFC